MRPRIAEDAGRGRTPHPVHGPALSAGFPLGPPGRSFFDPHRGDDRAYTSSHLVKWLVTDPYGYRGEERAAFVRACARGRRPEGVPDGAAALVGRHAPVAEVTAGFERRFRGEPVAAFPAEARGRSRPRGGAHSVGTPASRYSAAPRSRARSAQRRRS